MSAAGSEPSSSSKVDPPIDSSWRQVHAFLPNRPHPRSAVPDQPGPVAEQDDDTASEWEFSEDEELVTLDLGRWGQEHGTNALESNQVALTGLDTPTPWFQRGQVVYRGQWAHSLGTEIFLERTRDLDGQPIMRPLPQRRPTKGEPSTTRSRILFTPSMPRHRDAEEAPKKPAFPNVQSQHSRLVTSPSERRARKQRQDGRTYAQDWMAKVENALERREVLYSRGDLPANGRMRFSQPELARRRKRPESQSGAAEATEADTSMADPGETMQIDHPEN